MMQSMPQSWRMVKLGDLTLPVERKSPRSLFIDTFDYIDISAVDNVSKRVVGSQTLKVSDAPSRARQVVFSGDTLVSTVRPGLNTVARVPNNLPHAIASTGFCVLRPRSNILLPDYLFNFVTKDLFAQRLVSLQKGGAYPAVTDDDVRSVSIPLPPLSEQQRIVEILHEAQKIYRLRVEAEAKTSELIPTMFRELFGEIGNNSKNWHLVPVSSFVKSFQGGKSLTGIEGDFDLSRPRVLKISAVTSGFLVPSESKALPSGYDPPDEHFVRPRDLLITRANTEELVGATALVAKKCPANLVLPDKIWRFVWKEEFQGSSDFVWALFQERATRRVLSNIASGTGGSMKNISMKKLMQMRVVWPPKELQEKFSTAFREVLYLCDTSIGDKTAQILQASLSAYAFSGQITANWREPNRDRLSTEAHERDAVLKEEGAILTLSSRAKIQTEIDAMLQISTDGIYSDLNNEQRDLLREIGRMVGGVPYARYFTAQQLSDYLFDGSLRRNPQAIEGHLTVLAARGLIIPVSREEQTEDTGEFVFGNCYRLPIKSYEPGEDDEGLPRILDYTRLRELERLAAQLERERGLK